MARGQTLTDRLRGQHADFRTLLDAMETARGGEGAAAALRRLLPLLAAHERLERRLLYPALLAHGEGIDPRLIASFEDEHKQVHDKLAALRAALGARDSELGRLVAVAEFVGLLREHLEDEEQTLFPLVEGRVPRATLVELASLAEEQAAAHTGRAR